jgi:hypothetical protein
LSHGDANRAGGGLARVDVVDARAVGLDVGEARGAPRVRLAEVEKRNPKYNRGIEIEHRLLVESGRDYGEKEVEEGEKVSVVDDDGLAGLVARLVLDDNVVLKT